MKKVWMTIIIMAAIMVGCTSGADNPSTSPDASSTPTTQPSPSAGENSPKPGGSNAGTGNEETPEGSEQPDLFKTPEDAAAAVILALKDSDMDTLKTYIHPKKGILFSPYAHVDAEHAMKFTAGELPGTDDDTLYVWGSYDGSGEPIELTFGDYYKKFVYDKDFVNAEKIGWDEIVGSGNTGPNLKEVFPDCYVVDYHFSGFDEQNEGMDWESLILVLEANEGSWYVSALVHSQWTI